MPRIADRADVDPSGWDRSPSIDDRELGRLSPVCSSSSASRRVACGSCSRSTRRTSPSAALRHADIALFVAAWPQRVTPARIVDTRSRRVFSANSCKDDEPSSANFQWPSAAMYAARFSRASCVTTATNSVSSACARYCRSFAKRVGNRERAAILDIRTGGCCDILPLDLN